MLHECGLWTTWHHTCNLSHLSFQTLSIGNGDISWPCVKLNMLRQNQNKIWTIVYQSKLILRCSYEKIFQTLSNVETRQNSLTNSTSSMSTQEAQKSKRKVSHSKGSSTTALNWNTSGSSWQTISPASTSIVGWISKITRRSQNITTICDGPKQTTSYRYISTGSIFSDRTVQRDWKDKQRLVIFCGWNTALYWAYACKQTTANLDVHWNLFITLFLGP